MSNIDNPVSKVKRDKRRIMSVIAVFIMMTIWIAIDPDAGLISNLPYGAKLIMIFATLSKFVPYVLAVYLARKILIDYVKLEDYFKKANDTPQGAGLAIIGVGLLSIAFSLALLAATSSW